jgi:hypothetical protein
MEYLSNYEMGDELQHYGVLGMKWGVRRASRNLSSATTREQRDKAIASLEKHKAKGTAKVQKLEKQHVKLQKKVERAITKSDTKASDISIKAAHTRNKAYGTFVTRGRSDRLLYKANKLDAKANNLKALSEDAKARLAKNEKMTEMFNREIKNIDQALVDKGRRYING